MMRRLTMNCRMIIVKTFVLSQVLDQFTKIQQSELRKIESKWLNDLVEPKERT